MGTDQKELYRVTRVGQPPTLSHWAQELGRAGRDGKASTASLLVIQGRGSQVDGPMREFMRLRSCLRMQLVRLYNPTKYSEAAIWGTLPGDSASERALVCCIVCRKRNGFVSGDDYTQVSSDYDSDDDEDYDPTE